MIRVHYPPHPFKIKEDEERKEFIFDEQRKIWLRLTSEEWVRQNFVQYLIQVMQYPAPYVAVEREIKLGARKKRFDIMVFNQAARPWMMVECKKMEKKLDSTVIWQALHYNIAVPVKYLVLTNGEQSLAYVKGELDFEPIKELPAWE
ncbi:MAG TPA: type I restriction enzyme HsdR N-terminal domain-containing protein [Chitinophagaceae bacterium]|nr:type I restriction enzyme HsdR N-terminal domain-containing protein [Chitinophagaceae bacterium]